MKEIFLEWSNECDNPLCHENPVELRKHIFCNSLKYHGQIAAQEMAVSPSWPSRYI